jgi:hypothetical protein
MGVVRHQLRHDARLTQLVRDRVLPDLDRAPRSPEKVGRAAEQVVPGRHAGQRSGVVISEAHRSLGEAVQVRRGELVGPVGREHVAVQRVEENDDDVGNGRAGAPETPGSPVTAKRCSAKKAIVASRSAAVPVGEAEYSLDSRRLQLTEQIEDLFG